MTIVGLQNVKPKRDTLLGQYKRHWALFVMLLPVLVYYIIFHYFPMSGIIIAFKNFRFNDGMFASPWAADNGLAHFKKLFTGMYFAPVFRNTLIISLYKILFTFPAPILLALMLNEIRSQKFKRVAQTITYMPYFISWVVLASIVIEVLSPSRGFVNYFINQLGMDSVYFTGDPRTFRGVLVGSGMWRNTGYQAIVFLAAMSNIDPEMYDVADLDGAGRMQKIVHVTVPSIMPTIIIMFIFAMGSIMNDDFDQVYNLLNAKTLSVGDVISTYTYRVGLQQMDFSYATAVGLFRNVVSLVLLTGSNFVFRRVSETSLF
ncbi:MAG: ABC transporter permease subunit [Oscillospiraceae bacterium]|jgi:putative aldouronate transport system permease protein|nr:ABC transporter permease subunit [Oscillospiraceae bacterium]